MRTTLPNHSLKQSASDEVNLVPSPSHGFEPIGSTLDRLAPLIPSSGAEAREVIAAYIRDVAQELHDAAPITSSVTRAFRIYQQAGGTVDRFISALHEAQSITKERSGSRYTGDTTNIVPAKRKMAYFFACLEDKLGLRSTPQTDKQTG